MSWRAAAAACASSKPWMGRRSATSFANGGMMTPSMADPWNAPGVGRRLAASLIDPAAALKLRPAALPSLASWGFSFLRHSAPERHRAATLAAFRLADLSRRETAALRQSLGLEYDHAAVGTMKVFRERRTFEAQIALARLLEGEGLRVSYLDRDGVLAAEPMLRAVGDRLVGGMLYPDDETGDARAFTTNLVEHFFAAGGRLDTGMRITGLRRERGRVAGVVTADGDIAADAIVVAMGTSSRALLQTLGLRLPVRPAKGFSLTFPAGALPALPRLPVVDEALHVGVVPIGERLRLVGFAEFAGEDRSIPPGRIAGLMAVFRALYPDLARAVDPAAAAAWAGLRPMSADGLPFIGKTPIEGLWLDTGHGHLGWTMAAGSARLLADLIDGRPPPIDPAPYRADR